MQYLEIQDIITDQSTVEGVCVGKVKGKLIVGPIVNKALCYRCIQKRLLSSSFVDLKSYKRVSKKEKDFVSQILQKKTILQKLKHSSFEFVSVDNEKEFLVHFVVPLPGCKCVNFYEK